LQGQIAAEAEAMTKLTAKSAQYRSNLKLLEAEIVQLKESATNLRATLAESTSRSDTLSHSLKEQAEAAVEHPSTQYEPQLFTHAFFLRKVRRTACLINKLACPT
jgi:chromosome segregation ATPase